MPVQVKKGYVRGVIGMVITEINADGTDKVGAIPYGIKTAQEVSVENEIVEGEAGELRGGDKILVYVKDDDTVVGVNLTLTDARFDAQALVIMAGGTLIESGGNIVGWEAPSIADQQNKPVFKADLYAKNYNAKGVVDGYIKYSFRYCKGTVGDVTHSDAEWATQEINIWAQENPSIVGGPYRKEFVDALPAELQ